VIASVALLLALAGGDTLWQGEWRQGDHAAIVISTGHRGLVIDATAEHGGDDPHRTPAAGGFRVEVSVAPAQRSIEFAVDANVALPFAAAAGSLCAVTLQRYGALLEVHDNGRCGGDGLSFTGLYRRR
jgi:hypothetical protein